MPLSGQQDVAAALLETVAMDDPLALECLRASGGGVPQHDQPKRISGGPPPPIGREQCGVSRRTSSPAGHRLPRAGPQGVLRCLTPDHSKFYITAGTTVTGRAHLLL